MFSVPPTFYPFLAYIFAHGLFGCGLFHIQASSRQLHFYMAIVYTCTCDFQMYIPLQILQCFRQFCSLNNLYRGLVHKSLWYSSQLCNWSMQSIVTVGAWQNPQNSGQCSCAQGQYIPFSSQVVFMLYKEQSIVGLF